MVEKKISVPVIASIDTEGILYPVAFVLNGNIFNILQIVRADRFPTENGKTSGNKVFCCRTGCGYVQLYFYSGKWHVRMEE